MAEPQIQGQLNDNLPPSIVVGTRIPPFFKRKRLIPEHPAPVLPRVQREDGSPVPEVVEEIHDDASSASSDVSLEGARDALEEARPDYMPLGEARRRLEGGGDLPGNEGVGKTGGQEGPRFARLRKRAVWVHEAVASYRQFRRGEIQEPGVGGDKTSFQGIRGYIRRLYGPEVELVAGQRVEIGDVDTEGLRQTDVLLRLALNTGVDELDVSLGIVSRLVAFFSFRPLDKGSLMLARGKAVQYAKDIGLSPELLAQVLAGSVAMGLYPTRHEVDARRALRAAFGLTFDDEPPQTLLGLVSWVTKADRVFAQEWYATAPDPEKASRATVAISERVAPYLGSHVASLLSSWWNSQRSGQ